MNNLFLRLVCVLRHILKNVSLNFPKKLLFNKFTILLLLTPTSDNGVRLLGRTWVLVTLGLTVWL